jgi:hypothetical protein
MEFVIYPVPVLPCGIDLVSTPYEGIYQRFLLTNSMFFFIGIFNILCNLAWTVSTIDFNPIPLFGSVFFNFVISDL